MEQAQVHSDKLRIVVMIISGGLELRYQHCARCHADVPVRNPKSTRCGKCKTYSRDLFPADFDPKKTSCDKCRNAWEEMSPKQRIAFTSRNKTYIAKQVQPAPPKQVPKAKKDSDLVFVEHDELVSIN